LANKKVARLLRDGETERWMKLLKVFLENGRQTGVQIQSRLKDTISSYRKSLLPHSD